MNPDTTLTRNLKSTEQNEITYQSDFTAFKSWLLDVPHDMANQMTGSSRDGINYTMYDTDGKMYNWLKSSGEHFVQDAFHAVLKEKCQPNSSPDAAWKTGVVLDVGANTGFYGLLAIAYGCAVVFFEPQPDCVRLLTKSIEASNFDPRKFRIIRQPLGNAESAMNSALRFSPGRTCDGRFPIRELEQGDSNAYDHHGEDVINDVRFLSVSSAMESLALSPGTPILLMKVDTEGGELRVLDGLLPILGKTNIMNIVVEIPPMWWKHTNYTLKDGAHIIQKIAQLGSFEGATMRTRGFAKLSNPEALRNHIIHETHSYQTVHGRIYQEDLWLHHPGST